MTQRTLFRVLATAAGVAVLLTNVAVATGGSAAKAKKVPKNGSVVAVGKLQLKPNRFVKEGYRWRDDEISMRSGGTLTITNKTPGQDHTASLVKKSGLPRNVKQQQDCYKDGLCDKIFQSHGAITGPPTILLVDVGDPGFNEPGDSLAFQPKTSRKVKVTAKKGSTLYALCAIHVQMQQTIHVK